MKNHYQTVKNNPRTPWKKLPKCSIQLQHARGSISKKEGAISKQFQETEKTRKTYATRPIPTVPDGSGSP